MSPAPRHEPVGERGIALLIVLLTLTLLTIIVIEFTDAAQVETHLALSARNALQATYLARSGVNVAEALLSADALLPKDGDNLKDLWANPWPPLPIGDGTVAFRIRDEGRFLNLNDMFSRDGHLQQNRRAVFERLFTQILGIDPRVLAAIVDWIDEDHTPSVSPPGAEQPFYLGLTPPVQVRDGPLLTLRELLLVRGITPSILARIEPFVTVLPRSDTFKVNANTAPPEVLRSLTQGLFDAPGVVERLITTREAAPFVNNVATESKDTVSGLAEALGSDGATFLTPISGYFRIEAVAQLNDVHRGIVALVKRDGRKVTRVTWTPSSTTVALTSQPPSDFLATLPPLGGGS